MQIFFKVLEGKKRTKSDKKWQNHIKNIKKYPV